MRALKKYRYEFPPREAHFLEAPSPEAVVRFLRRTYPRNFDDVLPTLVEVPAWPPFWRVLDDDGRIVPPSSTPPAIP